MGVRCTTWYSFRHTWRPLARTFFAPTPPTAISTRLVAPAQPYLFLFASTRKTLARHKQKTTRIKQNGAVFLYSRGVMQIKKLKVRPQKSTRSAPCHLLTLMILTPSLPLSATTRRCFIHYIFLPTAIDQSVVLCGPQLASMLGCWAATKDVKSIGPCRDHAQALFECMRTAVRFSRFYLRFAAGKLTNDIHVQQPMKRKQHRPSINYHLARLGKTLKD
jgi:hypothetical protein